MDERIAVLEELVDDLKDELITLYLKYKEQIEKLDEDLDRVYNLIGLIR
jgi:hypothetical protein